MGMARVGFAAELLVKLEPCWIESLSPQEKIIQHKEDAVYPEVGEIIVVKPDGWKWGKKECPPKYIVIKVPNMPMEKAKIYEGYSTEDGLSRKTYKIPLTIVNQAEIQPEGKLELSEGSLKAQIIEKEIQQIEIR